MTVATPIKINWQGFAVGANERLVPRKGSSRWIKSDSYRAFLDSMAAEVMRQTSTLERPLPYPVDVALIVTLWCGRDTDSVVKPAIDALVRGGLLRNDNGNCVRSLTMLRYDHARGEQDSVNWIIEPAAVPAK